jgi:hypothetical protein
LSSFEPTQGTGAATLGIFSNGENGAYEKGDGCTDQTKLTLTGYRRESFVIDRVVTSGKEGLDTHHFEQPLFHPQVTTGGRINGAAVEYLRNVFNQSKCPRIMIQADDDEA